MKNHVLLVIALSFLVACNPPSGPESNPDVAPGIAVRKGSVIKVKLDSLEFYKSLHAAPWESVNARLKECNIRNYSIYYRDGYLFSYLEYTGTDWEADMARMASDSATQAWWKLTDPCQEPVESAAQDEWWADMEEVYHLD